MYQIKKKMALAIFSRPFLLFVGAGPFVQFAAAATGATADTLDAILPPQYAISKEVVEGIWQGRRGCEDWPAADGEGICQVEVAPSYGSGKNAALREAYGILVDGSKKLWSRQMLKGIISDWRRLRGYGREVGGCHFLGALSSFCSNDLPVVTVAPHKYAISIFGAELGIYLVTSLEQCWALGVRSKQHSVMWRDCKADAPAPVVFIYSNVDSFDAAQTACWHREADGNVKMLGGTTTTSQTEEPNAPQAEIVESEPPVQANAKFLAAALQEAMPLAGATEEQRATAFCTKMCDADVEKLTFAQAVKNQCLVNLNFFDPEWPVPIGPCFVESPEARVLINKSWDELETEMEGGLSVDDDAKKAWTGRWETRWKEDPFKCGANFAAPLGTRLATGKTASISQAIGIKNRG